MMLLLTILPPLLAAFAGYILRTKNSLIPLAGVACSLIAAIGLKLTAADLPMHYGLGTLAGDTLQLVAGEAAVTESITVALVATCIFVYARGYMHEETGKAWFWPAMSLFVGAMQLLVMAGDWFFYLTAWEVMGLASFLLIATWHDRADARYGAVQAFLITRFTDLGLYAGVILLVLSTGTLLLPSDAGLFPLSVSLLMLLAVMGKSAQVPFQGWLSGAMAGPTPVSALLHSATMVGAGALLLIRMSPHFGPAAMLYIAAAGGLTILLTGLTALFSDDIKQLLAASTSSQLGFMLLALGTGHPGAAFAHWIAHALMKSSLFLGAGIFQQTYGNTTFDAIGGAGKNDRWTYLLFVIPALALSGIPPLIGYVSKDALLEAGLDSIYPVIFFSIALAGALLTGMYCGKALNRLYSGSATGASVSRRHMQLAMAFLVLLVAGGGFFLKPLVSSNGFDIPEGMTSRVSGIAAALTGLAVGWRWKDNLVPEKISAYIRSGYALGGGYRQWIGRPVLVLAKACAVVEDALARLVERTGQAFTSLADQTNLMETLSGKIMEAVGYGGRVVAVWNRQLDERIQSTVEELSVAMHAAGDRARKWQSGLVHRELAITLAGTLLLILLITVTLITQ